MTIKEVLEVVKNTIYVNEGRKLAYRDRESARWHDRPPATPDQEFANGFTLGWEKALGAIWSIAQKAGPTRGPTIKTKATDAAFNEGWAACEKSLSVWLARHAMKEQE